MSSGPGSQTPLRQAEREGEASAGGDREALRCECGSLLARYVGGQIELKCRRCKRTVIVPITGDVVDEE